LRGCIVSLADAAPKPGAGRDINDAPAFTDTTHLPDRRPRTCEGSFQAYRDDGVPFFFAHVEAHAITKNAGVVHQDVDSSVIGNGRLYGFFCSRKRRYIGMLSDGIATLLPNGLRHLV